MQSGGDFVATLAITFNDGKSVKSGSTEKFTASHTFDQSKKITKIVTTIQKDEKCILQIKFYSNKELLCTVGWSDDDLKKYDVAGRVVTFEIAADEQLIGAELYNGPGIVRKGDFFRGVTWLKMKIAN